MSLNLSLKKNEKLISRILIFDDFNLPLVLHKNQGISGINGYSLKRQKKVEQLTTFINFKSSLKKTMTLHHSTTDKNLMLRY